MVITKNVHPAIVSEEEYELAKATIMFMNKPGYRGTRKFALKGNSCMVFDFGYRLKNLRQQHHLTQTQVANRLNLSKTSISGYENNVKTPSQDVLIKLAGLYRVSTDYLLGLDDEEMISVEGLTRQQRRLVEELVRMLQEKT